MTATEKILSGVFFFLLAPLMILFAPTGLSLTFILAVGVAYGFRQISTSRSRCKDCGSIFVLKPKNYVEIAKGNFACPSCNKPKKLKQLERM